MLNELEQLLILQDRDRKIRTLRGELKVAPLERKQLDEKATASQSRLDAAKLKAKEIEVRTRHRIPGTVPVMFVQAELADPSDFHHKPKVRVGRENGRVVIHITRCCSIPHAVAAAALEIASEGGVPEVHFGWSEENPVTANLHFVLFGSGNVPWMVYTLIRRADVPEERKPRVVVA